MNIKIYTTHTDYSDYRSRTQAASRQTPGAEKAAGNYDKATFNIAQSPVDESSFARILSHEAAGWLEKGVSQEKVDALHRQVASGTYKPEARSIAEHMLGYR